MARRAVGPASAVLAKSEDWLIAREETRRIPPPSAAPNDRAGGGRGARTPLPRTNRWSGNAAYAGGVVPRGAFRSRENVQQLVEIGLIVVDGWRHAHEMLINLYVNLCLLQLSGDPLRVSYNKADN